MNEVEKYYSNIGKRLYFLQEMLICVYFNYWDLSSARIVILI